MAETIPRLVPVEGLAKEPYRALIAYPKPTVDAVDERINQLSDLGVDQIDFNGPLEMGRLSVLGKGVVGLVFAGVAGEQHIAVKIRRVDSRRANMSREAEMMKAANTAGIGPRLLGSSRDVLKMEFVNGQTLPSWISSLKGRGTRARVRATLKLLLVQCARLDAYGLDHGELSRAHKNVLVSAEGQPTILDYESASLMRRVNNFTSIAQYLFLSGRFSHRVIRVLGPVKRDELLSYLRLYKSGKTNDAFEAVVKVLGV
jgi:putative serine/threonine protein kinase